jgi:hypothetical protein
MNDKHETAYRAAYESAQTEIGQIYERLSQLRARQEQIQVAADALKLLVGSDASSEAAQSSVSSKAVFEINTKDFLSNAPAPASHEVEEESTDPIQQHIKKALRVPALA